VFAGKFRRPAAADRASTRSLVENYAAIRRPIFRAFWARLGLPSGAAVAMKKRVFVSRSEGARHSCCYGADRADPCAFTPAPPAC